MISGILEYFSLNILYFKFVGNFFSIIFENCCLSVHELNDK